MRHVFFICTGMLIAAVAGGFVLRAVTGDAHVRDVTTVSLVTLASAHLSMVPLMLCRRSRALVVIFQAGFVGTVLHLFLTIALGAAAYALHLVEDRRLYVILLMAFYWVSLMLVVVAMIRVFRKVAAGAAATAATAVAPPSATPATK